MNRKLADIITDTRLESEVHTGYTIHFHRISDPNAGLRLRKVEERWKRGRELGSGGFATVWLETCTVGSRQGQLRAVKEIKRSAGALPSSEFARELEAVGKFSQKPYRHCFVRSFGWYETETRVFLAMEYMDRGDLDSWLCRPYPEMEASAITYQLLEGLGFMHGAGFVHRDLKPKNILVQIPGPNWWIKIADFGIAKRIQDCTGTATLIGTEGYMAPEARGIFHEADLEVPSGSYPFAVDIWAVGVIAWRIITNQPAFATLRDLSSYVLGRTNLPFTSGKFSSECDEFIKKTLAASPGKRPTSKEAVQHLWIQMYKERYTSVSHGTEAGHDAMARESTGYASWNTASQENGVTTTSAPPGLPSKHTHPNSEDTSEEDAPVTSQGIADVLLSKNSYKEDERFYRRSVESLKRVLGEEHKDTLDAIHRLAFTLYYQNKYKEAEQVYRQALDGRKRVLGEEHKDTLHTIHSVAGTLYCQGKYKEAEQVYRQALIGRKRVLGEKHKDTLDTIYGLIDTLCRQGKYKEVEQVYRQALNSKESIVGEEYKGPFNIIYSLVPRY
ncbi:hypothetical protein EsH8_V_001196 [Colletotrichum jinshuiense]